jgi:hypothetical protein
MLPTIKQALDYIDRTGTWIAKHLAVMTVGEKIGQLNMVAAGYAVTGQVWQAEQPRTFAPALSACSKISVGNRYPL